MCFVMFFVLTHFRDAVCNVRVPFFQPTVIVWEGHSSGITKSGITKATNKLDLLLCQAQNIERNPKYKFERFPHRMEINGVIGTDATFDASQGTCSATCTGYVAAGAVVVVVVVIARSSWHAFPQMTVFLLLFAVDYAK